MEKPAMLGTVITAHFFCILDLDFQRKGAPFLETVYCMLFDCETN